MNNNPIVSIVVTTYNSEAYLKKQLNSLISQTYKNIKIFVFDDCSTDSTIEILKTYEEQYDFIKVIQHTTPLGVIKNFEYGISFVDSELIALCDHDDIWMPDKISLQVESIKEYKTPALVHSDLEVIDANDQIMYKSFFQLKGYSFPNKKSLDILISRSGIMGNTILFNRALKQVILPFFENIPMHDYYIGVMNEIYGTRITISQPLVKYRIHNTNIGNRQQSILKKIKGFFYNDLPYVNRKVFLLDLLNAKLDSLDKSIINDFLKCIEYNKFEFFLKCLNKKEYFKGKVFYKLRLILRYIIKI